MNKKEQRREVAAELEKIKEFLRDWDPIDVISSLEATGNPPDEYDTYAPKIHSMLQRGCSVDELAKHLDKLITEDMGLKAEVGVSEYESTMAKNIVDWWRGK
ncbi:MAG: hypothetical protein A3G34_10555 [Candidatus Lindowbacteria bacterium RIFCSPLOWO2_12_FULL_62_27]|nr:MAG: hypothetical protein A3G34_10555 [Candidatus Lindowbacteria bacterium RIFCSPLOWO2_12_FULL_62_27]